jgi:hypothetical protein
MPQAQMPQGQARPAIPVQPGQPGAANAPNALKQLTPERARELQKQMEAIQALHNKKPKADVAQPVPQPGTVPQVQPVQ